MNFRVSVVLAMAVLAVVALPTVGSANLLVEGGFEGANVVPLPNIVGPPFIAAKWGDEVLNGFEVSGRIGTMGNGLTPRTGSWMLQMTDDGLSWTQAMQFVDITGLSSLHATAYFNSDAPAALAQLNVVYYTDANGWGAAIGQDPHNLTLDNNVATWQSIDFVSTTPVGATWARIEVAYADPSITGYSDYSMGGYVDDVSLVAVPEPGSMLALLGGFGTLAGFVIRKRK